MLFLLLIISLTTGCFLINGNSSIRGADIPLTSQGTLSTHNEILVRLIEKEDPAQRAPEGEEEKSFKFKKPIGDSCVGSEDCSHEKISYESTVCQGVAPCKADLFIVEFDDQGQMYHPQQMDHLFEFLKITMSPKGNCTPSNNEPCFDDVSLVVAAHGWRHNADFQDWNLRQLREVLYNAVVSEADPIGRPPISHLNPSHRPRKVVGVYVGWRGAVVKEEWLPKYFQLPAWLTFWDRKGAAMDVALGSTRELFARLGHVRAKVNDLNPNARRMGRDAERYASCAKDAKDTGRKCVPMRTLILGHSFGSLAIYNAISESLIKSVAAEEDSPPVIPTTSELDAARQPSLDEQVSSPYADLIVLINPAFEGARFEPLYQASLNRMKRSPYSPTQGPVLVLVTGTSDIATKWAFPFGRWFSTRFTSVSPKGKDGESLETIKRQERTAEVRAVGHIPRYMTHYLDIFHDTNTQLPEGITDSEKLCLKTDWYELTSKGVVGGQPLETTVDGIAALWKNKRDASVTNSQDWPARAYCGGMRLSPVMHEAIEGKDPLCYLPSKIPDQGPWSNQLALKDIPNDTWRTERRDPHNPIWVVRTHDKRIINGHNGYQNSNMVGFIMQLYRDVISPK